MAVVWVIAFAVFLIAEAATYQIVSLWFAAGAFVALALELTGFGLYAQIGAFVIVSVILLCLLRPLSLKLLKNKVTKTNADGLIGKTVTITEVAPDADTTGRGKINGMEWAVRSLDGSALTEGEKVCIKGIEGVKLMVERS